MKTFDYTITDPIGMHARPAGQLAKLCNQFGCKVSITKGDRTVKANQLMKLIGMGIKQNDTVRFTFEGAQEEEAAEAVEEFMTENL